MLSAVIVHKFVSYDRCTIPKNILKGNFIMIIFLGYTPELNIQIRDSLSAPNIDQIDFVQIFLVCRLVYITIRQIIKKA